LLAVIEHAATRMSVRTAARSSARGGLIKHRDSRTYNRVRGFGTTHARLGTGANAMRDDWIHRLDDPMGL